MGDIISVINTLAQNLYSTIEKEVFVEIEPTYVYSISSEEREMLARLVYLEANIESLECQKAVVSVVINRWQNGYWGDTLKDVVYAPNQFSPAYLIPNTTPTNTNYEAVDYVLKNKDRVRIITNELSFGPKEDWMDKAQTVRAKQMIKKFSEK